MAGVQISGARWPADAPLTTRLGPYQDGSGNLWVVTFDNTTVRPAAFKSSDGGATWGTSFVASSGGGTSSFFDTVFDSANGIIYALVSAPGPVAQIWKFTISTTTWVQVSSATGQPTVGIDAGSRSPAFLCYRPSVTDGTTTGKLVVVYQGPTASNMGTPYNQMYYITCRSDTGAWGTGTLAYGLSGSAINVDVRGACVGASDRVHMLCTGTASAGALTHISLSSANALDTAGTSNTTLTTYGSIFYNATLGKVVVAVAPNGSGTAARATSGASPTWTQDSNTIGTCATFVTQAYDETGGKLYVFASGSGGTGAGVAVNSAASTTWGTMSVFSDAAGSPQAASTGTVTGGIGVVYFDTSVYFDTYSFGPVAQPLTCTAQAIAEAMALVAPPAPALSTLTDDFSAGALDTTKWSGTGGYTQFGGVLDLTLPSSPVVKAIKNYDLTGSSMFAQLTPPTASSGSPVTNFRLASPGTPGLLEFGVTGGAGAVQLAADYTDNAGSNVTLTTVALPGSPIWLRIRESGGTVYWDYSTDGTNWTNLTSIANPFPVTQLVPSMQGFQFTGSDDSYFDNFNIPYVPPPPLSFPAGGFDPTMVPLGWF